MCSKFCTVSQCLNSGGTEDRNPFCMATASLLFWLRGKAQTTHKEAETSEVPPLQLWLCLVLTVSSHRQKISSSCHTNIYLLCTRFRWLKRHNLLSPCEQIQITGRLSHLYLCLLVTTFNKNMSIAIFLCLLILIFCISKKFLNSSWCFANDYLLSMIAFAAQVHICRLVAMSGSDCPGHSHKLSSKIWKVNYPHNTTLIANTWMAVIDLCHIFLSMTQSTYVSLILR